MIEIPQNSIDVIERIISENEHFVLLSHKNPDGDALGSSLALSHYLKSRGKNAVVVLPNLFPDFLAWLPGADDVILYENNPEKANDVIGQADAFFCLDFNALNRIGDVSAVVEKNPAPKSLI